MQDFEMLNRKFIREQRARIQAEEILEKKSMELYELNQKLLELNQNLENIIELRSKELRETELVYRSIVESASDLIFRSDSTGRISYINSASQKMLGFRKEEVIGRLFSDFIEPDSRYLINKDFFNKLKSKTEESYMEIPVMKRNGDILQLGIKLRMFFEGNKLVNAFAIARDITERLEAEKELISTTFRLETLIKNLNFGVLVENQNREIVLINNRFTNMFSINAKIESLVGMDCSNSADQSKYLFKDEIQFVDRIAEILKNRIEVLDEILELKDGRTFKRDYLPIYHEDVYLGHLWVYKDISVEIKDKNELLLAKLKAEKSRQAEKQFLAHISHEIRTPLNSLIGMNYLLSESQLNKEQEEYVSIIKNSSDLLLHLVNDVLDLSKIEAEEYNFDEHEYSISSIIEKLVKSFQLSLQQKNISISHLITNNSKRLLIGDSTALNQILFNSLGNAVKFTPKGSIKINCNVEENRDNGILHIEIKDTGIGIEKSNLKSIFNAFKQASSNQFESLGTGLGLTITKKLVELQGGKIDVESTLGLGSTFSIWLPIKFGRKIESGQSQSFEEDYRSYKVLGTKKILVVEDNMANQIYIAKLLKNWNFEYVLASSGQEVLELIKHSHFDIIFMDLQMPVMSGIVIASKIRNQKDNPNSNTVIVALTASALLSEKEKSLRIGMNAFLTKPYTPKQLLDLLTQYFDFEKISFDHDKTTIPYSFKSKYINYSKLDELYGNDKVHLLHMLKLFFKNTPDQISKTIELKDANAIREQLHKLKSTFSMVGLIEISQRMGNLEYSKNWSEIESEELKNIINEINKQIIELEIEYTHLLNDD